MCVYNVLIICDLLCLTDKELQIGHKPANAVKDDKVPLVAWEPYFCVLLQDEQTLTAYRSEELSVSCKQNKKHQKSEQFHTLIPQFIC